jgi:hypothetical protein
MKTKISDEVLRELSRTKNRQEIALETGLHYDTVRKRLRMLGLANASAPLTIQEEIKKDEKRIEESLNAKKVKYLLDELNKLEKEKNALLSVGEVETYSIKEKNASDKSPACSISLLSDWHYEEPVKSSQVNGLNRFDTNIAKERAESLFKVIAQLIKVHQREYQIDTHILALLGDFISGSIHEELKEANSIQPTQAIWEVQNIIASGIEFLLGATDVDFIIPCSSGNHARITEKQRSSTEFGNSLETLMYRNLEKYFSGNKRIKFIINDSYLTYISVFNWSCRFHHGHALRYSGGIGGLFIPAYKAISQWNKSKRADYDFFAHFHQLKDGGTFICNGSLIGYNAYSVKIKADYERPKQAFIIIDKERGMDVVRKITL